MATVDRLHTELVWPNRGPSLRNRRRREHGSTHGGGVVLQVRTPWPAASGACGYGVLGRHLRNGEHGEVGNLTARSTVVVAASRRPPKGLVNGGRDLEREHSAGEGESDQNMTKNQRWRFLRARASTVELEVTSAMAFALGRVGFTGGGE